MANRVKVCVTLTSEVEKQLRRRAVAHGVSFSAAVNAQLEYALRTQQETEISELLGPKLQTTIKKEMRGMANRFAHLLSKAVLESATSKQLVFQLLVKELGVERASAYKDKAWRVSAETLKKPLDDLNPPTGKDRSEALPNDGSR